MTTAVESKSDLQQRLDDARVQTDKLFEIVKPEALYDRPIAERHRIIFYLGHLEAFDWNLLASQLFNEKAFNPSLDKLFAFGIDPVDGGLPSDQPSDWPRESVVRDYQRKVRERVDQGIERALSAENSVLLLNVAIEHRLMHAETLAYMLHQLPLESKVREEQISVEESAPPANEMIEIPEGMVTLGISQDSGAFGWDNEFEGHRVDVPCFEIDRHKVTNADYLRFIEDGGYENRDLWTEANWKWRTDFGILHPVFWKLSDERWNLRTMFDQIPLPLSWPVYVSHAEALAYARWAGKELPTESEWQRAAYGSDRGSREHQERDYPWGSEGPDSCRGYFDFRRWDPIAVGACEKARSAFGLDGLLANGWEWTSTVFAPFAGFQAFPFYPGYSADFFDGKHYVMKGGSPRTDACMLRRSFRNWFQPRYQYVYAGFRCVSR